MQENFEQKSKFTEKDAEKLVGVAMKNEEVFKQGEKKSGAKDLGAAAAKKEKGPHKPHIPAEIDRIGETLVVAKRELREAEQKVQKAQQEAREKEKRFRFLEQELEKAKSARDKIKEMETKKKEEEPLDKEQLAA